MIGKPPNYNNSIYRAARRYRMRTPNRLPKSGDIKDVRDPKRRKRWNKKKRKQAGYPVGVQGPTS